MEMVGDKLSIIKDLMEELIGQMQPSGDDFSERLGRKKPGVEVMKIEGELPLEDDMDGGDMAETMEGEMESSMAGGMQEDPEDSFKRRLMKLRG